MYVCMHAVQGVAFCLLQKAGVGVAYGRGHGFVLAKRKQEETQVGNACQSSRKLMIVSGAVHVGRKDSWHASCQIALRACQT